MSEITNVTTTAEPADKAHGIVRFLRSSKTYAAITATVLALVPLYFAWGTMTPSEKASAVQDFATKISIVWGAVIVGTAFEDYGEKRDTPRPQVQVNVPQASGAGASSVGNVAATPPSSNWGEQPPRIQT
jgi:hypothetical protein